ncbi:MAG: AAA family ATPase [Granulosicoccus sp.]
MDDTTKQTLSSWDVDVSQKNVVAYLALDLLGFFLSCRAAIKAMTTAQQANMTASASEDKLNENYEPMTAEPCDYLRSAIAYASPTEPLLIAIGGLSGTGKSTIARALACRVAKPPGAILIHSDAERKINAGVALRTTLPTRFYTKAVTEGNYRHIMEKAQAALSAGQTVIVDSTFISAENRIAVETLAQRVNAQFAGLWLQADETTMRERVAARKNDISDATVSVLESQMAISHGEIDWLKIDSTQSLEKSVSSALVHLRHSIKLPQSR